MAKTRVDLEINLLSRWIHLTEFAKNMSGFYFKRGEKITFCIKKKNMHCN